MLVLDVAVAEQDVLVAFALVAVPYAARIDDSPIGFPGPAAQDELSRGAHPDLAGFDRRAAGAGILAVARDLLGPERVPRPNHEIAVAPAEPAALHPGVQGVPAVGGAVEQGDGASVLVEGPLALGHGTAVGGRVPAPEGVGPAFASLRRKSVMHRVLLVVVVGVHVEGESDLAFVARTLRRERLGLGPRQRGQQQRRQNGNNGDDDQQFDECEPPPGAPGHSACSNVLS